MIGPETVGAGIRLVRAEESWAPVIFGGMIPVLGAGAVYWLIRWAVKDPPEGSREGGEGAPVSEPEPAAEEADPPPR